MSLRPRQSFYMEVSPTNDIFRPYITPQIFDIDQNMLRFFVENRKVIRLNVGGPKKWKNNLFYSDDVKCIIPYHFASESSLSYNGITFLPILHLQINIYTKNVAMLFKLMFSHCCVSPGNA